MIINWMLSKSHNRSSDGVWKRDTVGEGSMDDDVRQCNQDMNDTE